MDARQYDVVVLGAGTTGENVADRAVKGGLSAVIVESALVGGECSYWACMPSKALLRPGQALEDAMSVSGSREAVTGKLNVSAVLKRRDYFTSNWNDSGQVVWLRNAKIDLVRGHARLTGERRVSVTDKGGATTSLTARQAVVICTGSDPALPDVPGLAEARPWTSREAVSARTAPRRLAILGGGVVACEMATAWKQLGSEEVTVIQRGARLIPTYEPFAGELLSAAFEQRGINVLTDTTIRRVERQHDGVARPGNDEIQLDLFLDYANNVALYPKFQAYFRAQRPPLLAVWGKNDPFFLPAGAEAFKRDQPDAEVHFYDTGHFALETHAAEIAAEIRKFLGQHLPAV